MKLLLLILVNLCIVIINADYQSCDIEWIPYNHGDDLSDAMTAGEMSPGVEIYLGRTVYDGIFVVGRIQKRSPWGLYHVSAWKTHRFTSNIEYMRKTPGYIYDWVPSQSGVDVPNLITPGYTPNRVTTYFGRIKQNGRTYLGKIIEGGNMHYENDAGNEVPINSFEALTCKF